MQILQSGELVRARGDRWRVIETRAFEACQLITLDGAGQSNLGARRGLLVPFDVVERMAAASERPRRVSRQRWRRALRQVVARSLAGELRAVAGANIDLLPHQLAPALAAVTGKGCRFLLADDVGLGKTIQAGAIVAELRARGAADRVLILTPPGLREQWAQELLERFHLSASVVDFKAVRERIAVLRSRTNPWTTWPTAIASVDYIKRPEVLQSIVGVPWDVVVVDEAHRVANEGDRHDAVAALASRAGVVVLLTATPHNGDSRAFDALCRLGSHGERLLVFRRTREAMKGSVERRVHRLLVRSSREERRMHACVNEFERAVRAERGDGNRDAWIALALLRKRAFSSAHALHLSTTRRLVALAPSDGAPTQLALPLEDHGEFDHADEPPAWQAVLALQDAGEERRLLRAMAAAAAAAAQRETKLNAIQRLLRRIDEPLIIFTEYRDTLVHAARALGESPAVLHGGLSRQDRVAALDAFSSGRRRVLLATDAAGEGLNLHQMCRVVVNLELPWNPMRLEQRIGRVDRIGQRRTVHAFHLIASGTDEERLLAALRERVRQAQMEAGAPDPFGGEYGGLPSGFRSESMDVSPEIALLQASRAFPLSAEARSGRASRADRPLVTNPKHRQTRRRLTGRALSLWEIGVQDLCGRTIVEKFVALTSPVSRVVTELADLGAFAEEWASEWQRHAIASRRVFLETRLAREHAIAGAIAALPRAQMQPGLFDRRAAHADAAAAAVQSGISEALAERVAQLTSRLPAEAVMRLRLVLLP